MLNARKAACLGGLVGFLLNFSVFKLEGQSSPSLQETYQWIASKLPESSVGVPGHDLINKPEIWWKGCDIQFYAFSVRSERVNRSQYEKASANDYRELDSIDFSSKDLNIGSLKTAAGAYGTTKVTISTTQSNPVIHYKFNMEHGVDSDGIRPPMAGYAQGGSATLVIQVESAEMAERMKRALEHAVTLCGGTSVKEVF